VAYTAGLAAPFLLSALAFERAQRGLAVFRRHQRGVQLVSGALLIGVGVLVLTDQMFQVSLAAQGLLDHLGLNFLRSV